MKLTHSKEWYEQRIALEGDTDIGAGTIAAFREPAVAQTQVAPIDTRIAFGTFVELWRRNRGWDAVKLAEAAGVNPEEILEIEHSPQSEPEPNAVFRLAAVFNMPSKILMELAGLIESRTPSLRQAAVRFAARSESVAELNPHEREAFEAFVSAIAETAGK
jgi:transcriptional regulator with XRE-family HTH domain